MTGAEPRPSRRILLAWLPAGALCAGLPVARAQAADDAAPSSIRRDERCASPALGRDLVFALYLPPGYAKSTARFPVAYLLHGVDGNHLEYLDNGRLQPVLDRLIADGSVPPMIVAMPEGGNSWYVDSRARGGPGDYGTAIGRDLPRHIEASWKAVRAASGRAIGGYSMGGFGALRLAFERPFRYAAAASLSGAFWTRIKPDTVMEARTDRIFAGSFGRPFDSARFVRENPFWMADGLHGMTGTPAVYLASGDADRYGAYRTTEALYKKLAAIGMNARMQLFPGDHDWQTWGAALPDMLAFFGAAFRAGAVANP